MKHELLLKTAGLGIVFYSPLAVAGIEEGEDYFSNSLPESPTRLLPTPCEGRYCNILYWFRW